jgi:hypothetical protein
VAFASGGAAFKSNNFQVDPDGRLAARSVAVSVPYGDLGGAAAFAYAGAPSSGTYTPRLSLSGSLAGAITGPATAAVASFTVNNDTLDGSAVGGISDLYIGHGIGAAAKDGRNGIFVYLNQLAAGDANGGYYVGIGTKVFGSYNAGGTSGSPDGNWFGANFRTLLQTGVTYAKSIVGMEADFGAQAGVTVAYKYGVTSVLEPTDAADASIESAGFVFGLTKAASGSTASPGTKYGLVFANAESWWPINTTSGTIIGASSNPLAGGPAFAAKYGIDFSNVSFTTAFLKSTGFAVDGAGNVSANNIYLKADSFIYGNASGTPPYASGGDALFGYDVASGWVFQVGDVGLLGIDASGILPIDSGQIALGSSDKRWTEVWAEEVRADINISASCDVYGVTAGGSHTIPDKCSWECLTSAATTATFTTTMPVNPIDNQEVWISTVHGITTWTVLPNTGQTISGAPTTLAANSAVMFRYRAGSSLWLRMV